MRALYPVNTTGRHCKNRESVPVAGTEVKTTMKMIPPVFCKSGRYRERKRQNFRPGLRVFPAENKSRAKKENTPENPPENPEENHLRKHP
jgi:hypothetical protein